MRGIEQLPEEGKKGCGGSGPDAVGLATGVHGLAVARPAMPFLAKKEPGAGTILGRCVGVRLDPLP
jgi:hypothetical protein